MEIEQEETLRAHALPCHQCRAVLSMYRYNVRGPWRTVPDEVVSKVRAKLCAEGARVLDAILLKGGAS
jgi:hypothetical protein